MKKTLSLRLRVTLVCATLLTLCCLLLTLTNNLSAIHLADAIQATPLLPAQSTDTGSTSGLPMSELTTSTLAFQAKRTFHIQSFLAMAAILAAGIFLIYYFVGKALTPLRELTQQIKTRTAEDLDQPVFLPNSGDEVWELANSFNQMSRRLNQVFVMQKNFSHSAAHEFRTPLAIMKTRIGLFRKKELHPSPYTVELLQILEGEVDRLSTMVGSLLDLTNLEQMPHHEQIPVDELLQNIADEILPQASQRSVSVLIDASPCPTMIGNRQLLHRALFNLVENAVKYSPTGGEVHVKVQYKCNCFRFEIIDQGPGIPEEFRQQIFAPFFRVDDSRSRQQGGTGLGLALVQAIAQFHGGSVHMEENSVGGSRFVLEFPGQT